MARNGKIILAKNIGLDRDHKNIVNYNESQLLTLLRNVNYLVKEMNDYSFIGAYGENRIKVDATYSQCLQSNYIGFQNPNYSSKWFFAFIDEVKYLSDGATEITYTIDDVATWFGNLTINRCFVLREHTNTDNYHEWICDEGLPVGDYINGLVSTFSDIASCHIVMATTISPIDGTTDVSGGVYGGVYSGARYYVFKDYATISSALNRIASNKSTDAVSGLFVAPDWLTGYNSITFPSAGCAEISLTTASVKSNGIAIPLHPTTIDGYTPKNKKCFNAPYVSYILDNNAGGTVELRLEDFYDSGDHTGNIKIVGTVTPGCSIRAIPVNYKCGYSKTTFNDGDNNQYGLTMGKFPICSFDVDMFTNWMTQNSVNMNLQAVGSTGAVIAGVALMATGVGVTAGASIAGAGAVSLFEQWKSIKQASLVPDSVAGNTNSGDVNYADGKLTFTVYMKMCRQEYIKQIDDYFTRFGYKMNRLKTPNITGRPHWNYVQIGEGEEIGSGAIPTKAMENINSVFRRGVTIWHHHVEINNFSLDNSI